MFRNIKTEAKVGIFIGVGIFLAFLIVFSISDFYVLKEGYNVKVIFDYVNGITVSSPVRYAGVSAGEVSDVNVYYDKDLKMTKVNVGLFIKDGITIEKDALARINSLGLFGEQYIEIAPGKDKEFLKKDDTMIGINPVNIGAEMEKVGAIIDSLGRIEQSLFSGEGTIPKLLTDSGIYDDLKSISQKINSGDGTLGKLLTDSSIYDDLKSVSQKLNGSNGTIGKLLTDDALYSHFDDILSKLKKGEGTIGKLLVEENVYNDLEAFVEDLKNNPWKLLRKTSSDKKKVKPSKEKREGTEIEKK